MPTWIWITGAGTTMAALSLVGSLTLVLPPRLLDRLVPTLVALAAGALLGAALFDLIPEAVAARGNSPAVWMSLAAGIVAFLVMEQYLHWHHCHRHDCAHQTAPAHRPAGYLILVADGTHNLIDGLAIGAAFTTSTELGVVTWLVIAAHEVPQELGDFGILLHSGWSRGRALLLNLASAATVLLGALAAGALSRRVDTDLLLPFAAGSFLYIALADLVPELTTAPAPHARAVRTVGVAAGLALLLAVTLLLAEPG